MLHQLTLGGIAALCDTYQSYLSSGHSPAILKAKAYTTPITGKKSIWTILQTMYI